MTTIQTLTFAQISYLAREAASAGDRLTVADCYALTEAYLGSDASDFSEMIDAERGEIRDAARRVAAVISDAEAAAS